MNWYIYVLQNYAVFFGRASRQEYWMFYLYSFLLSILATVLDNFLGTFYLISTLYTLGVLIPSSSVTIRRLHDIGKSGWWCWINLIPLIGFIWFFVLLCTESDPGDNEYGESPLY